MLTIVTTSTPVLGFTLPNQFSAFKPPVGVTTRMSQRRTTVTKTEKVCGCANVRVYGQWRACVYAPLLKETFVFLPFPQPFVLRCSAEGKRAKTNKARSANKGAAEPAGLSPALPLSFSLSHLHLLIQRHCKPAVEHHSLDALRSE